MSAEPKVFVESVEKRPRLAALGLSEDELTDALVAGASALAICTRNHPPIFPGLSFWAESVRALRDSKMADGWTRNDARNYSTVVNPDRTMQIAIARGDDWTGKTD